MFSTYRWIHEMNSPRQSSKKLRVFDMDDTLVRTTSRVKLTDPKSPEGHRFLTPAQYATYEPKEGEFYPEDAYAEFEELTNPKKIQYTEPIFRGIHNAGLDPEIRKLMILTARSHTPRLEKSVKDWLQKTLNVDPDKITFVAVGTSDPLAKSSVIKDEILNNGYNDVEFYDDSRKNVQAVMDLSNDPEIQEFQRTNGLSLRARMIPHNVNESKKNGQR